MVVPQLEPKSALAGRLAPSRFPAPAAGVGSGRNEGVGEVVEDVGERDFEKGGVVRVVVGLKGVVG